MILSKYTGVRPATDDSMQKIPGSFLFSVALDLSEMDVNARQELIKELQSKGLTTQMNEEILTVEGYVGFSYSRGIDRQGNRAIWIQAEGAIADLFAETLCLLYASRNGGVPSSGRFLRSIVAQIGELSLPDGTQIFVGASEEYDASLLSTDGCHVHPKLTKSQAKILHISNTTVKIEDNPFK